MRDGQQVMHAVGQRVLEPEVLQAVSGRQSVGVGFSRMRVRYGALMQGIAQRRLQPDVFGRLDWHDIAMNACVVAKLQRHPYNLLQVFAFWIVAGDVAGPPWPRQVANIVWAFAKVGTHNADLMAVFAAHMLQDGTLDRFNPQDTSNTVWAFATPGVRNADLMAAGAARMLQNGALSVFPRRPLATRLGHLRLLTCASLS